MKDAILIGLAATILFIFLFSHGLKIYGNYQICKNRFADMNVLACMMSDKTRALP